VEMDTPGDSSERKVYVVFKTHSKKLWQPCLLIWLDPGTCLDPTCGSGTTAYVAEQWVVAWSPLITSRVSLCVGPKARDHGVAVPVLSPASRQAKKGKQGGRNYLELRPRPEHNSWPGVFAKDFVYVRVPHITMGFHRQQLRDRRHLRRYFQASSDRCAKTLSNSRPLDPNLGRLGDNPRENPGERWDGGAAAAHAK